MMLLDPGVTSAQRWLLGVLRAQMKYSPGSGVPAPGNICSRPLRFKLGGRPVLSARLNVEKRLDPNENGRKFEPRRVLKPFFVIL
jgi:hypothetical protein